MKPLRAPRVQFETLASFDGAVAGPVESLRPDRYRLLEADLGSRTRIARGGGYSYAAASFGAGSLVVQMDRFNRVLRFDPTAGLIEAEAGVTLGDLLAVTARAGLGLSVQPGYPAITVGGCIAADVHGKNPAREGTFADSVVDVTLFHPDYGIRRVTPATPPGLLELVCGAYGLTGIIIAATLRIVPLTGRRVSIRRIAVGDPIEAAAVTQDLADQNLFAYSWHDATPRSRTFGLGFVYQGVVIPGAAGETNVVPGYRLLTSSTRRRLPFSVWRGMTARAFASVYRYGGALRSEMSETTLFDAMFPFAARSVYFRLFGRAGLAEYQLIVPQDRTPEFLQRLRRLILTSEAPSVMLSLKPFRGAQRLLRFAAEGTCITLDLFRSPETVDVLRRIDTVTLDVGGIPNIIKDSRLPREVVKAAYPGYERFRERLRVYDPRRIFRSELSERLEL